MNYIISNDLKHLQVANLQFNRFLMMLWLNGKKEKDDKKKNEKKVLN